MLRVKYYTHARCTFFSAVFLCRCWPYNPLHPWHWGNYATVPVQVEQPWGISVYTPETKHSASMMTSSYGIIFRVTGPVCGEFTGQRWIPLAKASDAELWSNHRDACNLRRRRAHYDVTVMKLCGYFMGCTTKAVTKYLRAMTLIMLWWRQGQC